MQLHPVPDTDLLNPGNPQVLDLSHVGCPIAVGIDDQPYQVAAFAFDAFGFDIRRVGTLLVADGTSLGDYIVSLRAAVARVEGHQGQAMPGSNTGPEGPVWPGGAHEEEGTTA